jgi:hypothetical protein
MNISHEQLRNASAVRIQSFGHDRWTSLKGNSPAGTVFGGGGKVAGQDALITRTPGGELAFFIDEYGNLTVYRTTGGGFGSGVELNFTVEMISRLARVSRIEYLSHLQAYAIRTATSELIRPH